METDTIAAIATGLSNAGISIIRISGENAIQIADQLFQTKNSQGKNRSVENFETENVLQKKIEFRLQNAKTHTLHYGTIWENGELLDEVLVSVMRSPNTYTRENVVEINCHGGIVVTKKILDAVLHAGARLAEPGEFTKRAFLNGRIDLSQAEAVIDIIQAKNDFALKNSVRQLKGNMFKEISELREQILLDIAFIEAALDDPEHISLDGFSEKLGNHVADWQERVWKLLKTAENGRLIKEGIRTVILGKPNAGKSSLLNLLLGENRAIVTDIAGTTRDTLEEHITLNGISLNIVDTAGIRWTKDLVERIGVDKAKQAAADADLILFVVDSSVGLDENDEEILRAVRGKKILVLLNKTDLQGIVTEDEIVERVNLVWEETDLADRRKQESENPSELKELSNFENKLDFERESDFEKRFDFEKKSGLVKRSNFEKQFDFGKGSDSEKRSDFEKRIDFVKKSGLVKRSNFEKQFGYEKRSDFEKKSCFKKSQNSGKPMLFTGESIIRTSTKAGEGVKELEDKITEMFFGGELNFNDEIYVTNVRHKTALEEAKKSLEQVTESIQMGMPEDFYSIDLMNAYRELGGMIGEEVDEDLVNTIFREFCMGK